MFELYVLNLFYIIERNNINCIMSNLVFVGKKILMKVLLYMSKIIDFIGILNNFKKKKCRMFNIYNL